jgi:hypothetical protein
MATREKRFSDAPPVRQRSRRREDCSRRHAVPGRAKRRLIAQLMRHDGCGGRAGRVELLTGIEGASSRPVRRIVLIAER